MAHIHTIMDEQNEDVVDALVFCSDFCHRQYLGDKYEGWHGCQEISVTEPCTNCEELVPGLDED